MSTVDLITMPEVEGNPVLRFTNLDLIKLSKELGPKWLEIIEQGLIRSDLDIIESVLKVAGKKDDGSNAGLTFGKLPDNNPPLSILSDRLLNAFSVSVNGRTYLDQIKHLAELQEKMANETAPKVDPTPAQADSSVGSSGNPSALL